MSVEIRKAQIKDIPHILNIQKECAFKPKDYAKQGGLIKLLPEEEIETYIESNALVYIAKNPKIVSYAIAHPNKNWIETQEEYTGKPYVDAILKEPFLYFQHLATRKNQPRVDIANSLTKQIEKTAKNQGLKHALGDVALNPLNLAAMRFHQRNEYNIVAAYENENTLWAIVHKSLS